MSRSGARIAGGGSPAREAAAALRDRPVEEPERLATWALAGRDRWGLGAARLARAIRRHLDWELVRVEGLQVLTEDPDPDAPCLGVETILGQRWTLGARQGRPRLTVHITGFGPPEMDSWCEAGLVMQRGEERIAAGPSLLRTIDLLCPLGLDPLIEFRPASLPGPPGVWRLGDPARARLGNSSGMAGSGRG